MPALQLMSAYLFSPVISFVRDRLKKPRLWCIGLLVRIEWNSQILLSEIFSRIVKRCLGLVRFVSCLIIISLSLIASVLMVKKILFSVHRNRALCVHLEKKLMGLL